MTASRKAFLTGVASMFFAGITVMPKAAQAVNHGPPPSTPPVMGRPNVSPASGVNLVRPNVGNQNNNPSGSNVTVVVPWWGYGYGWGSPYGGYPYTGTGYGYPYQPYDPNNPLDQNLTRNIPSESEQAANGYIPPSREVYRGPDVNAVLNSSPQLQSAEQALRSAQNDYEAATAAVQNSLAQDPAYKAAMYREQNAREELRILQSRKDVLPQTVLDAAARVLVAGSNVHALETKALTADSRVNDARTHMLRAAADRDRVRNEVITAARTQTP